MAKPTQEINAGSMADIAFLLLIFFLVTTTMDTNEGMMRKLPPPPENEENKPEVRKKERNVFVVLINRHDELAVEGSLANVNNLAERTKAFFKNPTNKENLSGKKEKTIPIFGKVMVSKGVVSLQNDRGTTYARYIKVQNELVKAINELRQEKALEYFGKDFVDLTEKQQEAVTEFYPLSISEAEPRAIQ
ncbi:MAG: biopolymer transporter ExbD [Bacteroidota bacterium]|nr:biopolymer transporter ExbD [Bacteroidota bacterium]